ncbi:MAG TPA: SpoIID/LytB domain-containing protein [Acidimicrobiales bacterium]|nr:SpoIID/LytB domain-containing protein [Acidimicrobiales bacterium]
MSSGDTSSGRRPSRAGRRPVAAGLVRSRIRTAAALTATVAAAVIVPLGPLRPAAADAASAVAIEGHGWGHGRGMGQWGALGYALQGTGYAAILDHFYGGTSMGSATNAPIRVRITANDGNDVIVTSGSPFTVAGAQVGAGQAARLHYLTGDSWEVDQGPGCGGPWTQVTTASDLPSANPRAEADPSSTDPGATAAQVLQLCEASGTSHLRGSIDAAQINGNPRTVDSLPLESYLRGVVPSESPASWAGAGSAGAQGQSQGFQALEAQAVAARSYAVAAAATNGDSGAFGYADICDSTACQVYGGMGAENASTDLAVADTAGQVRTAGGGVVSTEFSSSTGGWTAGGEFPSVEDTGDAVCGPSACNPNHSWTASVPASAIEAAYPQVGTLQAVAVDGRSGPAPAPFGGRVQGITIQGSQGSVNINGDTFAATFGLKSTLFEVAGSPSGGLDGYWVGASDGGVFSFGAARFHGSTGAMKLNRPVVGMAGTASGDGYWLVASDGGIFSFGDAAFHGSTGNIRLNRPVVGMAPTPDGAGYWLVASDGGIFTFGDATFRGSTGNLRLNKPIVGMAPTADGGGYWLVASDGGIFNFGDARFFGSTGSSGSASPMVQMAATPDGAGYWLLDAGGGVHPFGDAPDLGSLTGVGVRATAAGMAATTTGRGYLIVTSRGEVFSFGDAPGFGGIPDQTSGYPGHALVVVGHRGPS